MCPACCLEQGCVPPSPRGISALEGGNGGAGEETGAWHNGAPPVSQGTCVCQVSVKNRSWEQKREQHGLAWNGKVKGKSLCLSAPCLYFSLLQLGLRFSTFYSRSKRKVKGWKFPSPERSERLSSGGSSWPVSAQGCRAAVPSVPLPRHLPLPLKERRRSERSRWFGGGEECVWRGWFLCPL